MMERFRRSSTAGEYLHTHHLQEIKNQQLEKQQQPKENHILAKLLIMSTLGYVMAVLIAVKLLTLLHLEKYLR
jgi:hypothetical protein